MDFNKINSYSLRASDLRSEIDRAQAFADSLPQLKADLQSLVEAIELEVSGAPVADEVELQAEAEMMMDEVEGPVEQVDEKPIEEVAAEEPDTFSDCETECGSSCPIATDDIADEAVQEVSQPDVITIDIKDIEPDYYTDFLSVGRGTD